MSWPESGSFQKVLDPVSAYDRLAPFYAQFSERRTRYLRSVEAQIALRIPAGTKSVLDIGAGDGSRALRIAGKLGISRAVLLEPSEQMSHQTFAVCERWNTRVEDLDINTISERFDVVTCLWNVLGHIQGFDRRVRALRLAGQLLSPKGLLFVDVIHRYNLRTYGLVMTVARWLRDHLAPGDGNGDVITRWKTAAGEIQTYGHVFTDREIDRLAESAGLQRMERVTIDYGTGRICRTKWMGNFLYVLRRAS